MTIKPSDYLESCLHLQLTPEVKRLLDTEASIVTFPKGHHPVRQGEEANSFYFLVYGIVQGYYLDEEGDEHTKCFGQENSFFSSECFRTNGDASCYVECLEECKCIRIPYSTVRTLMRMDDEVQEKINHLYLEEVEKLEKRAKGLLLQDAEERYCQFCKDYPNLQNRIPVKYIASYIGIRASALSRIRQQLKKSL